MVRNSNCKYHIRVGKHVVRTFRRTNTKDPESSKISVDNFDCLFDLCVCRQDSFDDHTRSLFSTCPLHSWLLASRQERDQRMDW